MGFEEHAKVIIEIVSKTKVFTEIKRKLMDIGESAGTAANQLAKAGDEMRQKGLSSTKIRAGLKNFNNQLKKNNITLNDSGIFVNRFNNQAIKISRIANIATKSLKRKDSSIGAVSNSAKDMAIAEQRIIKILRAQGKTTSDIRASWKRYTSTMNEHGHAIGRGGTIIDSTTHKIQKMGAVASTVSRHSLRQFRGEFLSLMFIGQGLAGVFSSLMQPIWEITGLFDVWRAMLIVVLGPLLIPLAMTLIKIMKAMMGLSPETKNMIASFVLVGFVLAKLLAISTPLLILIHTLGGFGEVWAYIVKMFAMGEGAKSIFNLSGKLGTVLTILGKIFAVFQIITGVVNIVVGIIKKQVWPIVKGILLVIAGILFFFGGWIAAIGIGLGFLVLFASRIGKVRAVVMSIALLFVGIYETIMNIQKWVSRFFGGDKETSWSGSKAVKAAMGEAWSGEKLAAGGIVTRPTIAMVGEKGPEAVIPLSRASGASNLEGMNYNPTINVNVHGGLGDNDIDTVVRKVNERLRSDIRGYGI